MPIEIQEIKESKFAIGVEFLLFFSYAL